MKKIVLVTLGVSVTFNLFVVWMLWWSNRSRDWVPQT